MIDNNSTMGGRLEEEIFRVFGSLTKATAAIGAKGASYFRPYLSNTNRIGMTARKRFAAIGLDVDYIVGGVRKPVKEEDEITVEMWRKFDDIEFRLLQLVKDFQELVAMAKHGRKRR
ncbi:MAG: hypothetical protein HKK67_07225 [Chlorobiaceae bacterium]|nr:hypothetical protein [Chlorobiaceae bacterium]